MGKAMDKLISEIKARRNELPAGLDLLGADQESYPSSHLEVGIWSPVDLVPDLETASGRFRLRSVQILRLLRPSVERKRQRSRFQRPFRVGLASKYVGVDPQ